MNIFGAIPKKTMTLAIVLILILMVLFYFLFLQTTSAPTIEDRSIQPTVPPSQQTPSPQKTPVFRSTISSEKQPSYDIVFNIPEGFFLPSTIDNIEVTREISQSYIDYLKGRLEINGNPQITGSTHTWYTTNPTKSLMVDTKSGYVQYGTDATTTSSTKIVKDQVEKIAEDFLKTINITTIVPNTATITMYSGEGEVRETNNESIATFYEVTYIQSYKNYPIYYHFATPATISVFIDSSGNIRGLRHFNIQLLKTTQTTLLSIEQIKERVISGEYTIVQISGDQQTIPTTGTITIDSATAIQFDDKINRTLFPTILFEGILRPSGREVKIYFSVLSS